ncbi:AraC family transcriptional regulator [Dysgonomonas sp. Marseille-P4677]|uniref:AraC family transcriptional regulator n=1 Tax=Dysgonomonas sp. Marseille-P4677 TaxID=2364790 RepID=UPI001914ACBD|nr:AraC family transcriptional regulator [Dysgonomonas sp. Marseille-P4677]MBK5723151.1 AraC family transcriptional regulator [Dysgonomonas sp. Marseille-P4677]
MEKIAEGFRNEKAIVTPYNIRSYQSKNIITKNLYITHIGYYPKAKFHFRERPEGTPENILIYCEEGNGYITCYEEKYSISRNQVFIIPANTPHSYGSSYQNPWSIYWFHFCGEFVSMFSSIINKVINLEESDRSRFNDRIQLFDEMYQNLEMGYNFENLEYVSFCLMHYLASLKYMNQFREIKKIKETDVIQKSIQYMKDHLETKMTLDDIANHMGYSISHFGAIFLQRTSYSPLEYYNQLKIQRACSYLQFSDLKLKEIAFRLNFYDPFHFSKAFKKEMEITPKEYRKRYK